MLSVLLGVWAGRCSGRLMRSRAQINFKVLFVIVVYRGLRYGHTVDGKWHERQGVRCVARRADFVEDGGRTVNGFEVWDVGVGYEERIRGNLSICVREA